MGEPAEKLLGIERDECVAEALDLIAEGYASVRNDLLVAIASPDRSPDFRRYFESARSTWAQVQILESILGRLGAD